MRFVKSLLVFMSIMLIVGSAGAEMKKAKHMLEIDDPADDVRSGDHPGKDVVKVILSTDGKNLDIAVMLKKDAKFYLDGHMAGDVVVVYLDTDNNKETGGKPFRHLSPGFEYFIKVGACIEYEGGGTACSGALTGSKATNFFSTYALYKYTEDNKKERISEPFNWKDRGKDIKSNRIEVSLSYSKLNLSPGQSIRISIEEKDANFKNRYMPDVLLTLK